MVTFDPNAMGSINLFGEPRTFQRLAYLTARATGPDHWREVNAQVQAMLEEEIGSRLPAVQETQLLLLLNTLGSMSERIVALQDAAAAAVKLLEE